MSSLEESIKEIIKSKVPGDHSVYFEAYDDAAQAILTEVKKRLPHPRNGKLPHSPKSNGIAADAYRKGWNAALTEIEKELE